jgi:NagD protein
MSDPFADDTLKQRLRELRHLALDLDGTLYLGETRFDFTPGFLQQLRQVGVGHTFFTNNSSKSDRQYLVKLKGMGIDAGLEDIYSSTHATIDHLRSDFPGARRLFVLGTRGLHEQFTEAGYTVCDSDPEVVVIGFDTDLVYQRLARAAWWIQQGKPYLATHPDLTCPTDQSLVLPDCGAICRLLDAATGRRPDAVLGKPNVTMLDGLRQRLGLERSQMAIVGDRLCTDMAMARRAGVMGVLVLSGEARLQDLEEIPDRPDLVVAHAGVLGQLLAEAHRQRRPGS